MLECATYLTTATTKVDEMYFLVQRKTLHENQIRRIKKKFKK